MSHIYREERLAASGAKRVTTIAAEEHAHVQFVLLALEMLEEATHAAEIAVTIDNKLLLLGVEFIPGHVQRNPCLPREALQFGEQRPVLWLRPRLDRTFVQRLALIADDEVEIEIDGIAETLAARTGAIRIVE